MVVEGFYGDRLVDAHVRVLSISGTNNAIALIDAELLHQVGIPLWLMLDHTSSDFVDNLNRGVIKPGDAWTKEERTLEELAKALRAKGMKLTHIPLGLIDIVWAIPERAISLTTTNAFPGWKKATEEVEKRPGKVKA